MRRNVMAQKCPNCGASITKDAAVTYCEFCGTKITRKSKKGPRSVTKGEELYEQAVYEFKFSQYDKCIKTIFKALRYDKYNSDLLLMDAFLKNDVTQLSQIERAALSQDVVKMCKAVWSLRTVSISYNVDFKDLEKKSIGQLHSITFAKDDIFKVPSIYTHLAFAKILLSEKDYKNLVKKLQHQNDEEYKKSLMIVNQWKSVFKTKFWYGISWFALGAMHIFFYKNAMSIFLALLFGFIGLMIFSKRKKYRPFVKKTTVVSKA